ncbi:MAG: hypothetical protein ABI618_04355 [Nitrospirota bacterium]
MATFAEIKVLGCPAETRQPSHFHMNLNILTGIPFFPSSYHPDPFDYAQDKGETEGSVPRSTHTMITPTSFPLHQ